MARDWTYELRVRVDLDTEDTLEAARFLEVTPVAARRAGRMACEREDMTSVRLGGGAEAKKRRGILGRRREREASGRQHQKKK